MIIFCHAGRTKKGVKWPAVNQALYRKSYRSEALPLGSKELDSELGCYYAEVHLWPLKRPNSVKSADQGSIPCLGLRIYFIVLHSWQNI